MFKARSFVRMLIDVNCRMSRRVDASASRLVSRIGGQLDFSHRVLPRLLQPGLRVLDVGGGRFPSIDADTVERLKLHVTGLDISADELRQAPSGVYQATIVGDVANASIPGKFDLILSRSVLEHVKDTRSGLKNLAGALAEGGVMVHLVPCRNAPFAVVNRLLGHRLARRLLFGIYPERAGVAGFPAYYNLCVPSQMAAYCRACGLEIDEATPHFASEYFYFFAPAHALDVCRQVLAGLLHARDFAETFVIVARKPFRDR